MLGNARILGVLRGGLPEGVFLYVELFDPQFQRRPVDSEFGSRTIWPRNFSRTLRKSRFDECLLMILESLREKVLMTPGQVRSDSKAKPHRHKTYPRC